VHKKEIMELKDILMWHVLRKGELHEPKDLGVVCEACQSESIQRIEPLSQGGENKGEEKAT